MKILLTGATGFLGSKILRRLIERKEQVVILKRSTSKLERIREWMSYCSAYDVDKNSIDTIFEKEKPDVVIHCATTYGRTGKDVLQVVKTNLLFGLELLENAHRHGCLHFINTGTYNMKQICHNGRLKKNAYMADYTLSKYQFDCWGEEFAVSGKLNFINMSLEHIFGEDDEEGKFVFMVERTCTANVESLELSDGMQLRDYIYSENVVDAYMCVLDNLSQLQGYQSFEVGMGEAVLLKEFVTTIKEVAQSNTKLEFGKRQRNANEPECSVADISSLKKLGWKPKLSRREGIEQMLLKDKQAGRI